MLRFFKHNYIIQLVVIVLLAMAVWMPVFLNIPKEIQLNSTTTPLYNLLVETFDFAPWLMTAIVFLVFLFSMFFINSMLTVNQLVSRNSTLGSLMFILCSAFVPLSADNFQFVLASPFILITMQTIYTLLQSDSQENYLFNVGVFLAIASMFYYPSIVLIIWLLTVMFVLGYKSFRLYAIPLLGMLTPYFFLFVVSYFNRSLPQLFDSYSKGFVGIELKTMTLTSQEFAVAVVFSIFFIISLFRIKSAAVDNSIHIRKSFNITLFLLLFSVFMMAMQKPMSCNGMILTVLSIIYAMALSSVKKSKIADVILVIMIFGALAIQYFPMII